MDVLISGILMLVFFTAFLIIYSKNSTSLFVAVSFYITFACVAVFSYALYNYTQNPLTYIMMAVFLVAPAIIALASGSVGVFAVFILLFHSVKNMKKKERKSLSNRMSLLALLALLFGVSLVFISIFFNPPVWFQVLTVCYLALVFAVSAHFFLYITSYVLYSAAPVRKNKDFIIVLGSGLINGNVTPLLAARIDRAISFYKKQKKKRAVFIMSGGKGEDEPRAEAEAMAQYAIEKGIAPQQILLETKSKNTYENLKFSKELIEKTCGSKRYRAVFATNGYHVFRAAIYARQLSLPARGIGAKTKLYYSANAMIREYIAYFAIHRKKFAVIAVSCFVISALLYLTIRFIY